MLPGTGNRQKPRAMSHSVVDRNGRPGGARGVGRQGGAGWPGRDQFSFLDCKIRVASHSFTGSFSDLVSCETKGHAYGLGNPQA